MALDLWMVFVSKIFLGGVWCMPAVLLVYFFFFTTPKTNLNPFCSKVMPQRKPFKTLGITSPSKALLRMLERCLSLYTGPDSFPYTTFPIYKLSCVTFFIFFRYSLLPPKQILTTLALKQCPQRRRFKALGNTSSSKALLRMLEMCPLYKLYWSWFFPVCIQTFPFTNFPVLHFFSSPVKWQGELLWSVLVRRPSVVL